MVVVEILCSSIHRSKISLIFNSIFVSLGKILPALRKLLFKLNPPALLNLFFQTIFSQTYLNLDRSHYEVMTLRKIFWHSNSLTKNFILLETMMSSVCGLLITNDIAHNFRKDSSGPYSLACALAHYRSRLMVLVSW